MTNPHRQLNLVGQDSIAVVLTR